MLPRPATCATALSPSTLGECTRWCAGTGIGEASLGMLLCKTNSRNRGRWVGNAAAARHTYNLALLQYYAGMWLLQQCSCCQPAYVQSVRSHATDAQVPTQPKKIMLLMFAAPEVITDQFASHPALPPPLPPPLSNPAPCTLTLESQCPPDCLEEPAIR